MENLCLVFIQSYHKDNRSAIKPSTLPLSVFMHHISIDFQGELHSVWVSERQNIYNGVYSE